MAWAGSPTDMDSLFRGNEYKPKLSASLRDTTSNAAVPAKVSGKNDKSDGFYMLQFEAVGDFDAAQRRKAQLSASTICCKASIKFVKTLKTQRAGISPALCHFSK